MGPADPASAAVQPKQPNTIEGFWSLVKRGVSGVYHAISDKYLQSYLDEYSFRYNHRKDKQPMFQTFLCQVEKA